MKKLLILLLLVSCAKEVDDLGFRVYTIPAGEHSSGSFINHPDNSKIEFKFMLDESAIYETEIAENQHDVNKIYGMSATIDIKTFYYVIVIDNDTTLVRRRPEGNWGLVRRYYLYPYFGGNEYAPHDITIKIKE